MSNGDDLVGKVLGTCTLEQLIGRGGMGAVYLARQVRPVRRVAVKVLLPNALMNSEVYKEFLARFQREANLIAQLEHVNIMPIYEYGEQEGLAYLVMPYLTGGSLRDILGRRGALSLQETVTYIQQAALALDYAHAHGVIHRDLKPGNFLLHADGRLVLADFGIARMMQENSGTSGPALTGTGMFVGTPEYMAPEMVRGEGIDHRADIYELGIVLFQMLSGTIPFKGNTPYAIITQHVQEPLPSLHRINPGISLAVDAVVQQATAKRREDRFISAGALAQALRIVVNKHEGLLENDIRNAPTEISPHRLIATPVIAPKYETPPSVQPGMNSSPDRYPQGEPSSGGFSPTSPATPITSPATPITSPARHGSGSANLQRPWLMFIVILLVILLVIGGVLVGLQLRGTPGTNPSTGTVSTPGAPHTSGTATTNPTAASTSGSTPTPTPTSTQPSVIPKGQLLYSASSPGGVTSPSGSVIPCDGGREQWANYNNPVITCQSTGVEISNPNAALAGPFLLGLPNISFPSDYVIEVQLQQANTSQADFGVYFRNQLGSQSGVYNFLIHPDGSWSAYVYDNATGNPTELHRGSSIGSAYSSLLVDVAVIGSNFTFFVNGHQVGGLHDSTYPTGTVGIAVDAGGTIFASNFALYTIAS